MQTYPLDDFFVIATYPSLTHRFKRFIKDAAMLSYL